MNFNKILQQYENDEINIIKAIELLNENIHEDKRKTKGAVYTPAYIADFIIENINYSPEETLIEPSVGHGVFIFRLLEYIKIHFKYSPEELKKWFESKVTCFDIHTKTIEELKSLISLYFKKMNIHNICFDHIYNTDPLLFDFKNTFDVSIGNPPYIKVHNLEEEYAKIVRNKYSSCQNGNFDLYYAFIELMEKISFKSSMIVPNSYIINRSANNLRSIIKSPLEFIIDFKNKQIFENVITYSSIYKTDKNTTNTYLKYKENLENKFTCINKTSLGNKQWGLSLEQYEDNLNFNRSLTEVFPCYSEIATLRDNLYILENEEKDGFYFKEYNNKIYKIEKNICLDFYKITKIDENKKIIFPYDENLSVFNESKMKNEYPKTFEYFLAIRNELELRDKGKTNKYESWYAYGRKQGISLPKSPYYVLLSKMSNTNYNSKISNGINKFLFTSGFVFTCNTKEEAVLLKNILDSDRFFNYVKQYGKVWSGKTPYYTFTKSNLKEFKI